MASLLPVPKNEAHLWYVLQDRIGDADLLASYADLLSGEEHERHQRLRFAKDRHEYLVTRALARWTLSRHFDVDPGAWIFREGEHGKPSIAAPECGQTIHFNLSNTAGLVVCFVSGDCEVGVDAEDARREVEVLDLARRFFAPSEFRELETLPPERQSDRFFQYWTLKEAFLKAQGVGLSAPLSEFGFFFNEGGTPKIQFTGHRWGDPMHWQFKELRPTPNHRVATALYAETQRLPIHSHEVVPLVGEVS